MCDGQSHDEALGVRKQSVGESLFCEEYTDEVSHDKYDDDCPDEATIHKTVNTRTKMKIRCYHHPGLMKMPKSLADSVNMSQRTMRNLCRFARITRLRPLPLCLMEDCRDFFHVSENCS